MISLTEKASIKLKEIAEDDGSPLIARIGLHGGGCAGFTYVFELDDTEKDMDEVFESFGVTLRVDPMSFQYLTGVTIDYIDRIYESGFKFLNPNAKNTCGCNSSFGV